MNPRARVSGRRGASLVELLVGLVIFSVGVLGLVGMSFYALRQATRARDDLQYSADVQQVLDSLMAIGWNNVVAGSATERGRAMNWNVSAVNSDPQVITLFVTRSTYAGALKSTLVQDTVVFDLFSRSAWPF